VTCGPDTIRRAQKVHLIAALQTEYSTALANVAAEESANPQAGALYAQQYCARCHAIGDESASPKHTAPRFKDVANRAGTTVSSLKAWLGTTHPTMPNILLEPNDMSNVVAYILSRKN